MKRLSELLLSVLFAVTVSVCAVFCAQAFEPETAHVHLYECEILKSADCENGGLVKYVCKCGDEYIETTAPKGHSPRVISAVNATCTQAGRTEGIICADCEKILKACEVIEKKPHSFALTQIITEPSCSSIGSGVYTCTVCATTQIISIKPLVHEFQTIDKAPTCEMDGLQGGNICALCGLVASEPKRVPALGHSYNIYEETIEATCTKEGTAKQTCSRCGKTEFQSIPLKDHIPQSMDEVLPSCEKSGFSGGLVCSACGKVLLEQTETEPLGHSFSAWKTLKEASCTQDGNRQSKCKRCGAAKSRPIPAAGHRYETVTTKATFKVDGSTVEKCKTCGKTKKTVKIYKVTSASLSVSSYIYNGKAKTPAVTLKNSNGALLKSGTDYTVLYKNNKAVGTAQATVTLKGKYSGSKTLNFKIVPGKVSGIKASQTTSSIKLSWNKVNGAYKYAVYTYNKSTKKYTRIDTVKTNSVTVKNLKSGSTYLFSIRAFAIDLYSEFSSVFKTATKCTAPSNVKLKAVSKDKLNVSWKKVAGASEYEIFVCKTKDGKYTKVTTTSKTSAVIKLTGTTKYVKVRAVKKVGNSNLYSACCAKQKVPAK